MTLAAARDRRLVACSLVGAALLLAVGCRPPPDSLAQYRGGFDPTRHDAGPMPAWRGAPPTELRFGITPYYSIERQRPMLDALRTWLSEETGLPVVVKAAPDYDGTIDMLQRGEIDVAQLSPFAFVTAERRMPDVVPLATGVAQGSPTYASYVVALRSGPVRTLQDVRGKRFGFVDFLSTSGYLYPMLALEQAGIGIEEITPVRMGSHDAVLLGLKTGEIDVGATSSDTLVGSQGVGLAGPIRVVAKAGRIPYDCIAVRGSIDPALAHLVQRAFLRLSVHTERGREVLQHYNLLNGFMPVPAGHYDDVRARAASLRVR